MLENYVVIDMEMTGLNPKTDRILEIGGIKVENHKVIQQFSQLVNPHRELSQTIVELTGITTKLSQTGKEDTEAVKEFLDFCGELPLVGHHVISDFSFLQQCAVNIGRPITKEAVDTLELARRFLPRDMKKNLDALCRHIGIHQTQEHRALSDAAATYELLEWFQRGFGKENEQAFRPRPMIYRIKRQSPITQKQKKNLIQLMNYHKIELGMQINNLTRNEASRITDNIISRFGRIPSNG